MTAQRSEDWKRVREVFEGALAQPADRRRAFVAESCRDDPAIHDQVIALLASHEGAAAFLESPAIRLLGDAAPPVAVEEEADSNVGRVIGSYYIESCLGHGGMGTVYLARRADQAFERRVAIKMIRRGMDSAVVIRRFQHERQILASLDHPHTARLYDGGTTPEGLPYFVMEYIEGAPIDRYADEHGLNTAARIELSLRVLDAVQHAHDRHIVHRDLKPSNVLVTPDGMPKLLDFGIAKILDPDSQGDSTLTTLARAMTPDYASPEQVRGEPVTPATDVYALGLLLYLLLTGRRAYHFTTRTPDEIARVICDEDPPKPSATVGGLEREHSTAQVRRQLAGALDAIVMKAIRKEPVERYRTVAALADDLRAYLSDCPVSAARGVWRYRAARLVRRHRARLAVAVLMVVVITATALLVQQRAPSSATRGTGAERPDAIAAPAAIQPRPSVAVVPFRNLSARPGDRWLSTAVAEMLTTELVGDGQMRVIPADNVARAARDLGEASEESYERLRTIVGADHLIAGTFAVADGKPSRSLRLDVKVHRTGGEPLVAAGVGDESQLFTVVADAGRAVRGRLGLKASSPEVTGAARAAYPRSLDATRLYADGLARLRVLDAVAAQKLLEQADAREPGNPLVQAALGSAWTALGYDRRAAEAARKAVDASAGLNREGRLNVEGRLAEAQQTWTKAIEVYRTLWGFFSDNAEYGLLLATAQTNAARARDALDTLATIRRLPPPQGQDARIDLAEAQAQSALGSFKQELEALQRVIRAAQTSGSRQLLARAMLFAGRSYYNQGQPGAAEESVRGARTAFADVGDKAGVALALNSLGAVAADQDPPAAARFYQQSFAISEEIGDRRAMSLALNNLGIQYKDQRQFDAARRAHERALAIRREIGHRNWEAVSLSNIGVVLFEQDRFAEARRYYRDSLTICREIGDKRGLVRALHNLAVVDRETGQLSAAQKSLEESLAIRAEIGDRRGGGIGSFELGIVLLAQGEIGRAEAIQEKVLALGREIRLKALETNALFQLGEIALARGDFARARREHERALAVRRELKEIRTAAESEAALAALDLEEGRSSDAERRANAVLKTLGSSPAGALPVSLQLLIARARLRSGDLTGASRLLGTVRQMAVRTERIDVRTSLAMLDAELSTARGDRRAARSALATLRARLAESRMALADLEARLLLLRIGALEGESNVASDARMLADDARARGAELIVRRAQALQTKSRGNLHP